jgi:hypothetical protein
MKIKTLFYVLVAAMGASLTSCNTDVETIEIQDLKTYDGQYFQNLRDFKKSDHEISYAYYASWANTQSPTSWGERFLGLPDSLDIVNLWIDIPTKESYPIAYEDMKYCQEVKGTRFVMHADASNYSHKFWDRVWNEETQQFEFVYETDENGNVVKDEEGNPKHKILQTVRGDEESIRSYARWVCDTVVNCGLDGVDFDYEGWSNNDMIIAADECNKYFGPEGKWAEKLYIIDWFNGAPSGCDDFCDYFIRQAYTWQIGFQTGSGGRPMEKTVFCESTGAEAEKGGINGARVRDYAKFVPSTGRKGGFGAYYLDYNYKSESGIPYKEFREAIQIQNPALTK